MAFVSLTTRLARPHPLGDGAFLYKNESTTRVRSDVVIYAYANRVNFSDARLYTACRFDHLCDFPVPTLD